MRLIGAMCKTSEPANIVLVGFMGAGKSTVGCELERIGGLQLVDLDEIIVRQCGRTIPEIFRSEGEVAFRAYETAALRSLAGIRRSVVATGGGAVGSEANWQAMRALGPVVYLRAGWPVLRQRLAGEEGRPLVDGRDWERVEALWRQRLPLYERADLIIDADELSAVQVARSILQRLNIAYREEE